MAVTSMWPIKGRIDVVIKYVSNPEKTVESSYEKISKLHSVNDVIEYASDDMKTEKRMYVKCIGCNEYNAIDQFKRTLDRCGNKGDRLCYHGYQSFKENEVDAETANKIGFALAERLWGDKFQVVVATHCNTGHYHNHFIVCAKSYIDGSSFHNGKEDYRRMRAESDRLCKEYGLSIIENPEEKGNNYGEWVANKEGRPTLRDSIREAIDIAIRGSTTEQEFLDAMDELGYIIDQSGKYPKIKHIGTKRFVRFNSLGEGYTVDEILDRVYANYYPEYPDLPRQDSPQKIFENENGTVASFGYFAVYHCYFNALKITKERPNENRAVYLLVHQDHNKMRDYSDGVKLLAEHKLNLKDEILEYKQEALNRIPEIEALRNEMRNALRRAKRANDLTLMSKIRYNIDIYTRQLNKLHREVGSCDYVIERANEVKEKLQRIKQQKFKGKEMINDEHISRSSRPDRENES